MKEEEKFGFDPTVIMKVLVENKDLGLALVQIPLALLNNWLGGQNKEVHWERYPTVAGYYWIKNQSDVITVMFIRPEDLNSYRTSGFAGYSFAGPLVPPK